MATITLQITATSTAGTSGSATVDVVLLEDPSVSVSVAPQSAPAGTLRTATVVATDPNGLELTLSASRSDGGTITQTSSDTFQFTY